MPERKLQKKILLWITAIVALMALCILIALETVLHDVLRVRLEKEGVFIARHIAEASITPILTEKHFELDMMAKDLMKREEGIEYIFIMGRDGRILAHTFEGGFPVDLKKINSDDIHREYSVRRISTEKDDLIDISVPVLQGSAGVVHLGLSEKYITRDIHSIVRIIIGLMLGILLIMYVAIILLSRRMVRPVVELARIAEAVGDGDLTQKATVYADDEIGALSRIFNDMIQKRSRIESEREELIARLQSALHEVKTLSGLLPMCAWCNKIRNDEGYWTDVATYVHEHTDADFTHGICPDCLKKVNMEEGSAGEK